MLRGSLPAHLSAVMGKSDLARGGQLMAARAKHQSFVGALPRERARRTLVNWPHLIDETVDSYRPWTTLSGAVQKDAIQNSWDGRRDSRRARGWRVTFEVLKNAEGRPVLTWTDQGTWGLTGRVLQEDEYQDDLPPEERLARFDSLAFSHPDPRRTLGARGRGKFVFVAVSRRRTILYDTLLDGGVYRLGIRTVERTDSPVWHFEGEEAKQQLLAYAPHLQPLAQVGTRVIIDDPEQEILEDIRSGQFARQIAMTWWPIIEKFRAQITIRAFGHESVIEKPREFRLPVRDNRRYKVWFHEPDHITFQSRRYTIKRLHIVRDTRGAVPEDIRGVAIHRRGMKVTSIAMRGVGRDIEESVHGYVEFDRRLDEEMAAAEDPTHYTFNFNAGIGKKVKEYIEDQLERFGREKLGIGADVRAREAERHREAHQRALNAINRIARSLGVVGATGGGGGGGAGGGSGVTLRPIFVTMPEPSFPRTERRVAYGDRLSNINATVTNSTASHAEVRLSVYLLQGDATVHDVVVQDLSLDPSTISETIGPFMIDITENLLRRGECRLRARLVCLSSPDFEKGEELHEVTHKLWIEEDPPERGIFEKMEGVEYPPDMPHIDGEAVAGEAGGYILRYNLEHPAKAYWDGAGMLPDFLFSLAARELLRIAYRRDIPGFFKQADLESADTILRKAGELIGSLSYQYYGGPGGQ